MYPFTVIDFMLRSCWNALLKSSSKACCTSCGSISSSSSFNWTSQVTLLALSGDSFLRSGEEVDILQSDTEQNLFRDGKFVLCSFFTFRNLHTRIITRKMLQHVKNVFRIGVYRVRNFLRRLSDSRKFAAHVGLE